jgi:hypothetical protein
MAAASPELIDFAEAPARFMEPAPGRVLRVSERYAFAHDFGHTWAGVEGFRLGAGDVEDVVAEVAELVRRTGAARCSWWLTERSTPADIEERLLAAGLHRDDADHLHAGMLLTTEPPRVEGIEVRRIETLAEFAQARRLAIDAFANPHLPQPTDEAIATEWEHKVDPVFAAWIGGRLASVGNVVFTRVGGYLMGGSTAPWARGRGAYRAVVRARWDAALDRGTPALAVGAGPMSRPILERLGFEQVLQFRRLESVRDDPG